MANINEQNQPAVPNINPEAPQVPPTVSDGESPHKSFNPRLVVIGLVVVIVGYIVFSYSLALWPFGDLLKPLPSVSPIVKLDDCDSIDLTVFRSVDKFDENRPPIGMVSDYRFVTLRDGRFERIYSDLREEGSYSCKNNTITGVVDIGLNKNRSISSQYYPDRKILIWDGLEYAEYGKIESRLNVISQVPTDWKTYTNTEYGFEFKYPGDWEVKTGTKDDPTGLADLTISLQSPATIKGINDGTVDPGYSRDLLVSYFKDGTTWGGMGSDRGPKIGPLIISGAKATEVLFGGAGQNYAVEIGTVGPFWVLSFETAYDKSKLTSEQIQILSTFKLINYADTYTWKTYRNEEYGFEFKYPNQLIIKNGQLYGSTIFDMDFMNPNESYAGFSISIFDRTLDPQRLIAGGDVITEKEAKKIILDGITAYRFGAGDGPCGGEVVDVGMKDKYLHFNFSACFNVLPLDLNIIDQILSTFRFTR
ncbi:MAG: hypothetical protein A2655_01155 [Candidatus Yanofskybacteria bacterium RIFCSPHIGHO2_01_FULL_43_42]|uniref:Uncharacterized protein n=1 Tax=Candidatus Yanofskybacteria bacterium RIFCSPLOWO2_01_FULL_43_22 TaxID=1802695 RepID=A0A1F8GEH7_9BACT|nr:MAG: hypothetical protein A2655_01155 [Candidatus Yanofskybacteria bacterium RIFCSPHIGHO2_01_FULL_43_42]OGN12415.1 MAG: hypothetical protein A3D48_01885 [Candidatus Yanofskybacteria bacterium RIFCSPHIGHO2_02_FULL_43_17]OGN23787.1 MAG: hypothetical protein A3A13_01945 [Candidatus Yanofskybacteria bacterium RIFCSPLOWO2_01_FULL_43_22]